MKVLIENQLYDARRVFETNIDLAPEVVKGWRPTITEDASDRDVREFLESLGFSVLDI